jgi:Uma2 family endonuclease
LAYVEVISPSDTYAEVQEKGFDWLEAGTKTVILVIPRKRTVTVYRSLTNIIMLTEHDLLDGGEAIPGWKIAVRELFA